MKQQLRITRRRQCRTTEAPLVDVVTDAVVDTTAVDELLGRIDALVAG